MRLTSPSERAILRAMREPRACIFPAAYRQLSVRSNHRESLDTEHALFARRRDVLPVARHTPDAEFPYSCSALRSRVRTRSRTVAPAPSPGSSQALCGGEPARARAGCCKSRCHKPLNPLGPTFAPFWPRCAFNALNSQHLWVSGTVVAGGGPLCSFTVALRRARLLLMQMAWRFPD